MCFINDIFISLRPVTSLPRGRDLCVAGHLTSATPCMDCQHLRELVAYMLLCDTSEIHRYFSAFHVEMETSSDVGIRLTCT